MTDSFVSGFSRFIFLSMATVSLENFGKALENEIKKNVKQIKFAAMNAVNDVAFGAVRKNLISEYEKNFTVRNKSFPRAIHVDKATKDRLTANVSYKADFMKLHATGGVRVPERAPVSISVPIDNDAPGRHLPSGKVRSRDKVAALLQYANDHSKKAVGRKGVKHAFVLKSGGKAVVIKRDKGNTTVASRHRGNTDKVLYAFSTQAKIEKRWDFDKIVTDTAQNELPKTFEKRFAEAVKTAK